jgi:lipopolysaccharide transport system permease protein
LQSDLPSAAPTFTAAPSVVATLFGAPWRHRALLRRLIRRDILGRYRGSMAGLAWSLLQPLLLLAILTVVFSDLLGMRWGLANESRADFALLLFIGLILHAFLAECLTRAPSLVVGNPNFVKKVVFPLEILPWVNVGTALFHAAASVLAWMIIAFASGRGVPWTVVFLPLVAAPLTLFALGFSWLFAATAVYLRDVTQTTGLLTTALLFLSPVFYAASSVPARYRPLLDLNPLTIPIEEARRVMIAGELPDFQRLALHAVAALVVALIGLWWFQRTRRGFADVL